MSARSRASSASYLKLVFVAAAAIGLTSPNDWRRRWWRRRWLNLPAEEEKEMKVDCSREEKKEKHGTFT
jgi:hypothetical protein